MRGRAFLDVARRLLMGLTEEDFVNNQAARQAVIDAETTIQLLDQIEADPVRRADAIAAIRAAFPYSSGLAEASMSDQEMVIVEFFGMPRQRAQRSELQLAPGTAAEVLAAVAQACPGLQGLLSPEGRLAGHYLLSLDGQRFLTALSEPIAPGTRLLLLSADAGG